MNTTDLSPIITRFAPSPTGELHIGSVRTALFAYLAAKSTGGKFFLRIEDTDRSRYVEGSDKRLVESLNWLGLVPDNADNIVVQSERTEIYQKFARKLVEEGKAYICTCSKEKIDTDRQEQEKAKRPPRYLGTCRDKNIKFDEVEGKEYVVRLKMPQSGEIVVHDLVRGDVKFDLALLDDQIILKSDGFPTYHLASVIDDHEMAISHVLRAEEWLSSTPKHLVLYEALGWQAPKFGHFSMILAPDRTKLSKRHGATSVEEFRNQGYLVCALINFIALLGWNPKTDREIFTLEELVTEFKLENLNKAPAIFNIDKLNSLNESYIQKLTGDERQTTSELKLFGLEDISSGEIELIGRGGYKTLKEAADYIFKLRQQPDYDSAMLIFKKSNRENTLKALKDVKSKFDTIDVATDWNQDFVQKVLSDVVVENNFSNGDVFWSVRVALSGEEKSPSPAELTLALGKAETLNRLSLAIDKLQ